MTDAVFRCSMTNVKTGLTMTPQFNPDQITEELTANYGELKIMGQSYELQQYSGTSNLKLSFDLEFDALSAEIPTAQQAKNIETMRRYLQHLLYPHRGAQSVAQGAPGRVLFIWPELFSVTGTMRHVKIAHTRAAASGSSTLFKASCEIHQISDTRIFAEDILDYGTLR